MKMDKLISCSVTVSPEIDSHSLSPLAGRWNIGVEVKITNSARFNKGAVKTVSLDTMKFGPSSDIHMAQVPVENG